MTDAFDQTITTTTKTEPVLNNNAFEDKLKTIVNEQGQPKYKDIEQALDALKASQDHIKRLETESQTNKTVIDNAAAEKARADALEEIVQRMSNNSQRPPQVDQPKAGVDEATVVKTLETFINKREAEAAASSNRTSVINALVAKFGSDPDKVKQAVAAKATELDMTPEELGVLSSRNPKLVLQSFGLTNAPSVASVTTPSYSTSLAPKVDAGLQRPEKSLISGSGATDRNRKDYMAKIKEEVYKKYNVEV